MKILIVDDDLVARKYLYNIVKDYGYCEIAVNGLEAVEYFQLEMKDETPYDVVFLDIMMPIMDGDETLEKIRNIEEEKGIVTGHGAIIAMVSALSDRKNVLSAFAKGCEYYLIKPVQQNEVFEMMDEIVAQNETDRSQQSHIRHRNRDNTANT